ncbi:MAG: hypothetical protein DWQ36_17725 [Acidobacteria bacterium]|nr:MAG: hypothetical protein DWQ36_17725 [Acidobacteriota bacterium]
MQSASVVLIAGAVMAGALQAQNLESVAAYFDDQASGSSTIDGRNFAWATAVSPDGENVYACSGVNNIASGDEDDNAIAVFSRHVDGSLEFVQVLFDDDDTNDPGTADGLLSCRSVAVSPDGLHVYTAGSSDDAIGIFARAPGTGALNFLASVVDGQGGVDGLDGVESLAMTSDGSALFAVGRAEDALAAFSRNSATGALSFEDVEKNGLGGLTGLDRPLSVAVSPDDLHVYVASGSNANFGGSDALTVFEWDSAQTGLLFVDSYGEGDVQGQNTVDGLDQVSAVAVTPDGQHVYAASEVDTIGGPSGNGNDWIAVFDRNPATGELTWLQRIGGFRICPTSFFGADAESFLAVSGDGQRVFVTKNWEDNGVAMFARDSASGALTFLDGECEFDPGPIGMNLPRAMALDPGGVHLYVAGNTSDALAVLSTEAIFTDGFESGDASAWSATTL